MSNTKDLDELLDAMFRAAKMQYGPIVKGMWLHKEEECPGCMGKMTVTKFKGKKALSLNTFFYRDQGVIIAYMLCNKCANLAINYSKTIPQGTTPLHQEIEKNLKQTFLRKTGH